MKIEKFKKNSKFDIRQRGLLKIHLFLRRADIFNVREHYSEAHNRRKWPSFNLKKMALAVRRGMNSLNNSK